jgi:hypothetical protein
MNEQNEYHYKFEIDCEDLSSMKIKYLDDDQENRRIFNLVFNKNEKIF